MTRPRTTTAGLAAVLLVLGTILASAGARAAGDPCLIFVHGKQDSGVADDWDAARDYWRSAGHDFVETATRNLAAPHYVVSYDGSRPWWHAGAAGQVATDIVSATEGLADAGGNHCPSWSSGGTFWVVGHSMAGNILDFILGNADPSSESYNSNGPYDLAAERIALVITLGGSHRGSGLSDATCGEHPNPLCNLGGWVLQGCTDANFWLRTSDSVQVRSYAGPPARSVYLSGGYEAIVGASVCLPGEDDGVVQYASQFACSGNANASYANTDVCGNSAKQESFGFLNLDAGHENHDDERNDTDRDTRRAIPGGVWACGAAPCAPGSEVQSAMSTAQLVSTLSTQGSPLRPATTPRCGLGAELAFLLPLLSRLRRRS